MTTEAARHFLFCIWWLVATGFARWWAVRFLTVCATPGSVDPSERLGAAAIVLVGLGGAALLFASLAVHHGISFAVEVFGEHEVTE